MALSNLMIVEVRMSGMFPDVHDDYTDARILTELNKTQQTVFGREVVQARGGHWRDEQLTTTTAGRALYRIPGRAIAGGLEKIEIADSGGAYQPMTETTPYRAGELAGPANNPSRGFPAYYLIDGDQVQLIPAPSGAYTLRMRYYRRPGRLVAQQVTGTERGRVTAVNTTARTIVVNAVPFDQELAVPAAITSGLQRLDVIHPDGWHEVALTGVTQTLSVATFTIGGTVDMSKVEVGDYVRVAEQSDWPSLPDDFDRTLADATAIVILTSMNDGPKASVLAQKMGADLQRFRSLLKPRVKDSPRIIKPTFSRLHGRATRFPQGGFP